MEKSKVYIVDSKRSAIGKFLGSLYECDASDVCIQVLDGLFASHPEIKGDVDEVVIGNVVSAGLGQGIARKIAVNFGIPMNVPAYSVNMVCGSGMQAIINGYKSILCGNRVELCGGLEFMSNIPYATDSYVRLGKKFGDFKMMDLMVHDGLTDSFSGVHMGVTAENIARDLDISREEQDKYSYYSQQRAIKAVDDGSFNDEIVPVKLKDWKNREYVFDTDEFINRGTSLEKLASLKPSFIKDETGTITAGTASGINDGASFLILADESYCAEHGIETSIELVATASVGCDPQKMGLGPYYAIKKLLNETGVAFSDIDVLEINEAFAAQTLGCYKLMAAEYDTTVEAIIDKCNLHGSGLGLGHPLGATGSRIVTTLMHYMLSHDVKYGIASLCIGGGQGTAVLLKKK
ncbi:MAG: thiolase family protein [Ruminococcus sp.]|nr:thiolase family protein [Ruminococcus sp.]